MSILSAFNAIRLWHWRRTYRPGRTVTRFVAHDIRRDVEVIEVSKIRGGVITARICTWNVLYYAKNLQQKPEFEKVREIKINRLWEWSGNSWGGPVPPSIDTPTQ
jgi:hypothetical protein